MKSASSTAPGTTEPSQAVVTTAVMDEVLVMLGIVLGLKDPVR